MNELTREEFIEEIRSGKVEFIGYDFSYMNLANINEEREYTNIERIKFKYCNMESTNFHNSNMHCCSYFIVIFRKLILRILKIQHHGFIFARCLTLE